MATVNILFFHFGQLYGSLGESDGCGTSTILPVGSCFRKLESTPATSSIPTWPSSFRGDVPGTCSRWRSSTIPRGIFCLVREARVYYVNIFFKEMRTPFALRTCPVATLLFVVPGPRLYPENHTLCPNHQCGHTSSKQGSEGRCHPLFQRLRRRCVSDCSLQDPGIPGPF